MPKASRDGAPKNTWNDVHSEISHKPMRRHYLSCAVTFAG